MATQSSATKSRGSRSGPPQPATPPKERVSLLTSIVQSIGRLFGSISIPFHIQRQLAGVLFFILGAISAWSLIEPNGDGAVTHWWGETLRAAAGHGAFLIPTFFFLLTFRSFKTRTGPIIKVRHYLGATGFALAVAGLLDLAGGTRELGGTLGVGTTALLDRTLGEVATAILLLIVGTVGVFLLASTDVVTLVEDIRKIWPKRSPKTPKAPKLQSVSDEPPSGPAEGALPKSQAMLSLDTLGIDLAPLPPPGSTAPVQTALADDDSLIDSTRQPTPITGRASRASKARAATAVAEIDPFEDTAVTIVGEPRTPIINIPVRETRPVSATPRPAKPVATGPNGPWDLPDVTLLSHYETVMPDSYDLEQKAGQIEATLTNFKVDARVREINPGPAVTQFTIEPGIGTKVKRITELQNDLALALAAPSIRMEAPIPGKARLGIEIPNDQIATVGLREAIESSTFESSKAKLPLPLGRDVTGRYVIGDLAKMPHLLIAGSTGSGKSVCLNGIISTFLLRLQPTDLKMVMVDPKMVEMAGYGGVPHLQCPVITEMDKVVPILRLCVKEMERRYGIFTKLGVRNLDGYKLRREEDDELENLPFLVVIVDELADLMMVAPADVETLLVRLAQKGRACGIHLIIATQRPSADVITGLLKANIAARIAFMVTSQLESRVIMEAQGAEKLLGRGDMLFLPPDAAKPVRIQGAYVDDRDVESIVDHWKRIAPIPTYDPDWLDIEAETSSSVEEAFDDDEDDGLMERAIAIFRESEDRRASASYLQRRLKIGYNRAARIMERLEDEGRVGPPDGPRGRMFLG